MTEVLTGRCFCGDVRFAVTGPEKSACYCYCESCQRAAGAPVVVWATYDRKSFTVLQGNILRRTSSPGVTRGHCPGCGSTITYESLQDEGEIDVAVNCLDDPSAVVPRMHIWTENKPSWLEIGGDLPVHKQGSG